MNKLSKTAKTLDSLFSFLYCVTIVFGAAAIIGMIGYVVLYFLAPDNTLSHSALTTLELGFVEIQPAADYIPSRDAIFYQNIGILLLGLLACIFVFIWVKCIRNILKPMIQGNPFDGTVSRNLKKLAWLSVVDGILFNVFTLFEQWSMNYGYHITELLSNDKIADITLNYSFDLDFVVHWLILFLLFHIARYGEELQQLSDETL